MDAIFQRDAVEIYFEFEWPKYELYCIQPSGGRATTLPLHFRASVQSHVLQKYYVLRLPACDSQLFAAMCDRANKQFSTQDSYFFPGPTETELHKYKIFCQCYFKSPLWSLFTGRLARIKKASEFTRRPLLQAGAGLALPPSPVSPPPHHLHGSSV